MRITTYTAYAPDTDPMNLGGEYNRLMQESGTEWVCFLDHDAMWLRRDWYAQLVKHVQQHPDVGLVTTLATRIGQPMQRWGNLVSTHNVKELRREAAALTAGKHIRCDARDPISGVVMLTSRTAWEATGGFQDGFLGVDNAYHLAVDAAGLAVHMLLSNPVYHWYRADGDKRHLVQARIVTDKYRADALDAKDH